jgi:hypothetical protein
MLTAVGLVTCAFVAFIRVYFQAQGRYFYPAMASISLLFVLGWRWIVPSRYFSIAAGMLLALLGAFSGALLIAVARQGGLS